MLQRGLTPNTDNREALIGLGFERAYPHVRAGYDSKIWERSITIRPLQPDGLRRIVRERAFLEQRR